MRIDGSGTLRASCVLCPNPGPMTLEGTNTWILREPGARGVVVVDPGPHDERHLERVARTVQEQGAQVLMTIVTHRHPDHSEGSRYFSELTGAPVHAVDPAMRCSGAGLADGELLSVDGLGIRVVATPGHTDDSVCLLLESDNALLTGDTILGHGTPVIDGDDGLGPYMDSLYRLRDLVREYQIRTLLPGHGPILTSPGSVLSSYIDHRESRLDQVRDAVGAGATKVEEIVDRVYPDITEQIRFAASSSVRAQLRYLADRGELPEGIDA
ncbi:MBL fold metallo-hydrolase [Nocardiopsis aegyptia]|uniref:Glyoxylase-like metal-dependent hydrolase (Beta-lactamase superfamily II) n=1 Tax=Nocardiopsis aegyptia TaxID=220378 RepID=A0A7Z0EP02_9ACTN|nr:MBL fold metallo-hydrolase [Nocardiopsis aegyptia]NYJ35409.1 glyoxylase-like metal-dependent hydrolase (beta-lactamase superfamily II) [Nocardiopsis aegyptia]